MIHVSQLAPDGQWDQTMLFDLFANKLYPTGLEFSHRLGYVRRGAKGSIVIIPGRYWSKERDYAQINDALMHYEWVLAIRTSDEEDSFDIERIAHANIKWWVQTPKAGVFYDARFIPLGYPPHFSEMGVQPRKAIDVFLAAQNTHQRRQEAFRALKEVPEGRQQVTLPTKGFLQGLDQVAYREAMLETKVAPCPSGAVSPDTFRVYEALQAHAVPIADDISPAYDSIGYWRKLFHDVPFPIIENYDVLQPMVNHVLPDWQRESNRIAAWWMAQKRAMALNLAMDLDHLGAL